jgi:uncharacterized peroxidase-related enzyme
MTYIKTGVKQPGMTELLFYKGSTGKALSQLAQTLLHGPSKLTQGERELIAVYVSYLNKCEYCFESHSASANIHLVDDGETINRLIEEFEEAPVTSKMRALLKIAAKVQVSGHEVGIKHIEAARLEGASDEDIHDTVLIASAFCMFNRYVDGLRADLPESKSEYLEIGERIAKTGYNYPPLFLRKIHIKLMNKKRRTVEQSASVVY